MSLSDLVDRIRAKIGRSPFLERTDIPDGCKCDPEPWALLTYHDICDRFVSAHGDTACELCWHERECHAS